MSHSLENKIFIVIGIVVILVAGFFIISKFQNQAEPITNIASQSNKAPDFNLQDYNGKIVDLEDFSGKPLVINSWAAWCPFCRQELPDFATAQKEFGDKVVIIAIDRQESLTVAKGFTDEQGTTDDLIFLLDPKDLFYKSIGGFSMPETIFVDKDGNIAEH